MNNGKIMKSFQTSYNLNEIVPDLFLSKLGSLFLVFLNSLKEITIVSLFHDDAKAVGGVFEESLLVCDDVWVVNGSQNSNLVDSILFLLFREFTHFNLLHGIKGTIGYSFDLVDGAESTIAEFLKYLEVLHIYVVFSVM